MSCPVQSRRVRILDGGFSTQLSTHVGGDKRIDGDPLWTARFLATDRQAVLATHLDFLRAGADMIQTNTYQASIGGFRKYLGMTEEESLALMYDAVDIAKEARKLYAAETTLRRGRPMIVGSVGPYGAAQHDGSEYTGVYDPSVTLDTIKSWHKPRLEALLEGGVDLLALETIPNECEAKALIALLREYPQIQAWLSFSCRQDGKSLADGSDFRKAAVECYEKSLPGQLIAVGVNCLAPRFVAPLLRSINEDRTDDLIPLVVYPNSGEQYTVSEGWRKKDTCDPLENFVDEWLDLGVRLIGGCCRTGAQELIKIREAVERWELKHS